ncbi:putative RNA-binding protein [Trypanosoma theileri]|uniref:Putative RNA-binding protein n=1 Tax=Trypanosoma theileri TaxID=67003 RepID=A0A1X0NZV7_9TRYP|nr:putative RNA-binding protein [Trypanosoma theileri]ORC90202.1 putative RNA-binding protein [Trypanosoma theileri]
MDMVHQGMDGDELMLPNGEQYSHANLFIRHLSRLVNEDELRSIFAPYGEILSAAVMRNIHTGENLGTAFVRYATTEQARAALLECNGRSVCGRTISVHWAKKQHDDTPVGEARKKIFKLFVRNIPLDVTVDELTALFRQYGPVKEISIHKDTAAVADRRLERRIAFVAYLAEGAAERAAECVHNTRPFPSSGSIPLMVKLAEDLPARSRRRASLEVPTATTATTARKMTFGDVHASVRPCVQTHPTGISLCGLPPQPASCPTYADPNAASWSYTPPHHMNAARPLPYENIANPRPCRYYPPFPPMLSNVRAERLARSSLGPMAHQMSAWREFSQLPETVTIYNRSSSAYGMEVGGAPFSLAAHPSRGGIYSSNCSSMYAQEFEETSEKRMLHPPISHDSGLRQQQQYQYQQQQQQQEGLTGPNISKCGPQGSFSSSPDTIISEDVSTAGVTNTTPDSASHIRRYTHNPYKALRDENLEDPVTPLSVV